MSPREPTPQDISFTISKLDLKPGDIVIIRCRQRLTQDGVNRLRETMKLAMPDQKALVLEDGMEIAVLTKADLERKLAESEAA